MLTIEPDSGFANSVNSEGNPFRYIGKDEHGFICAELRWDGCMNVWIKGSVEEGKEAWTEAGRSEDDCDYFHMCDPIETLEALLEFAKEAKSRHEANEMWCG